MTPHTKRDTKESFDYGKPAYVKRFGFAFSSDLKDWMYSEGSQGGGRKRRARANG